MKLFVDNLWRYFEPKIEEKMRSSIRYYRAEVTANPGGNRLTVQRPFDAEVTIPCVDCMSDAKAGDQVLVMVFGSGANANNAVVVGDGSLRELGGSDTVPGQFYAGYGIELGHNLTNNIGGYIDFHYNGSDSDYTSRIIEAADGVLHVNLGKSVALGTITNPTDVLKTLLNPTNFGYITDFNTGKAAVPGLWLVYNTDGSAAHAPYSGTVSGVCLVVVIYEPDGTMDKAHQLFLDRLGDVYYKVYNFGVSYGTWKKLTN